MSRFRVAYQEVNGWNFYDVNSLSEAIRRAKLHRQAGARGVGAAGRHDDRRLVADREGQGDPGRTPPRMGCGQVRVAIR